MPADDRALETAERLLRGSAGDRVRVDFPLAPLTSFRIGGPAALYLEIESGADLDAAARATTETGLPFVVIGKGSNLLVADEGVDALVLKLVDGLATAEVDGETLRAGGGAALAVCLHRVRAAELGGLEFACAIPGTVGGGVWMNAGAYGGDIAGVLVRALVVEAGTARWLTPAELGLSYRRSALRAGQVVARAEFRLHSRPAAEIKATVAEMQARRRAAQPTNRRTFGSVFKNPSDGVSAGRMLDACGLRGHRIGGAQISPRHANFIENADGARSLDALALMAEARRRALEQFGVVLEQEVQFLGARELPPAGATVSTADRE